MATVPRPVLLQSLWVFLLLCFAYCDIVTVMDTDPRSVDAVADMTGPLLLLASVWMTMGIAMTLFSRVLRRRVGRPLGIVVASAMLLAQIGTLFVPPLQAYYVFFSVVEVAAMVALIVFAWTWPADQPEHAG
ncbi:MAG: DUF6326 family protein [Micrococcales bacterium]|nr:DUF6326 family protein [Micrococcales bacterium]MCL2668672.1 DUF6326 family protein [Micrococcales bacterium]